ncbi:MAG: Asp-tRNA(Asn)/Glu-tRNA(Gln) amidotransferase subunit GatB [Peptococcaceae bacterium]|jgi:aspartyl-tRNA(Asn)/glutamyl-tRNA(Gln) amidotransferase subunit B|nr:Asp-tRNA(Asn)/Glu-tRNA(Gln) amidotransferase subunit GatB [Peptococcaceae bacterium]
MYDKYQPVIGLEVHVELKTKSKIFCTCPVAFGCEPNTNVCPVCGGLPGSLPVLNKEVVNMAIKLGLAVNCQIAEYTDFYRKNYFYPDLPSNYQITQGDDPICAKGYLEVDTDGVKTKVGITRIHMEEDAGKLVHSGDTISTSQYAMADFNRTGTPLLEIVSEPDIRSAAEARAYLEQLKAIVEYLDISDCKMEEGSLRCDANISVMPKGSDVYGTRVEVKNLNSFKAVQKAIEYEIYRQMCALEDGTPLTQETRTWDDGKGVTLSMRSKESAQDYRYFPDPNLPPVYVSREWVDGIKASLPELPKERKARLIELGLPEYDAKIITSSKAMADYFDACYDKFNEAKAISNWMMGDLSAALNNAGQDFKNSPVTPDMLVELLKFIADDTISGKIAKTVFEEAFQTGKAPGDIVKEKGLVQIKDTGAIGEMVDQVIAANPQSVADFKAGKKQAIGFLVGQVMKLSQGKANPGMVNKLLQEKLSE